MRKRVLAYSSLPALSRAGSAVWGVAKRGRDKFGASATRVYRALLRRQNVSRSAKSVATALGPVVLDHDAFVRRSDYRNETWERVRNRFSDRPRLFYGFPVRSRDHACPDEKVTYRTGRFDIGSSDIDDDWVWMEVSEELPNDLRLSLTFLLATPIKEVQFGVRYVDFYNRYRFRFQDGYLHFDIVVRGVFLNGLARAPFELEVGRPYRLDIDVVANALQASLDGIPTLTVRDPFRLFRRGGVALIFWDDRPGHDVALTVSDVTVRALEPRRS